MKETEKYPKNGKVSCVQGLEQSVLLKHGQEQVAHTCNLSY
jgi:hypothetical protein